MNGIKTSYFFTARVYDVYLTLLGKCALAFTSFTYQRSAPSVILGELKLCLAKAFLVVMATPANLLDGTT